MLVLPFIDVIIFVVALAYIIYNIYITIHRVYISTRCFGNLSNNDTCSKCICWRT